jgi:hypothetical protein
MKIVYKINYLNQSGGAEGKKWPPALYSIVKIKNPKNCGSDLIGKIKSYYFNETAAVVELNQSNYVENTLSSEKQYNYGKGHYLLLPVNQWEIIKTQQNDNNINSDLPLLNTDYSIQFFKDYELVDNNKSIDSLSDVNRQKLEKKLLTFTNITTCNLKRSFNESVTLKNLMTSDVDFENEFNKFSEYIKNYDILFKNLNLVLHNKHIYIFRNGSNNNDVITEKLVGKLNHYPWQYNKIINYDVLKYIIFQNEFQQNLNVNKSELEEAERILSQEYVIAIQPKFKYLFWAIIRLISIWYADPLCEQIIKKIKITINQYRVDPEQEYNKIHGIQPSILIYPKYGVKNARTLISKLIYYFSLYMDNDGTNNANNIFWTNSVPTYYKNENNFIYYTNGNSNLKTYVRKSLENNEFKKTIYDDKMTKVRNSESIKMNIVHDQ